MPSTNHYITDKYLNSESFWEKVIFKAVTHNKCPVLRNGGVTFLLSVLGNRVFQLQICICCYFSHKFNAWVYCNRNNVTKVGSENTYSVCL